MPKKTMSSLAKEAKIGTPRIAKAAIVSSHATLGMRGASPLSSVRLRVCARSARVAHTPAISAAARPPVKSPSTLPAMPIGDTAAKPSRVTPPGTIAR